MSAPLITFENYYTGYRGGPKFGPFNFSVSTGERWLILGRNGTGKSTLLRSILPLSYWTSGSVYLSGKPLKKISVLERAKFLAYVPQQVPEDIPYSLSYFVSLARLAYDESEEERRSIVEEAIKLCGLDDKIETPIGHLSGGERQRAALAGAFAQGSHTLLLDEPTASLDPAHTVAIFSALRDFPDADDRAAIMVSHDVAAGFNWATHLLALAEDGVIYCGVAPESVDGWNSLLSKIYRVGFSPSFSQSGAVSFIADRCL